MTNGQNPLGFTLSAESGAGGADAYNVMLIEDDVYSELYFAAKSRYRRSSGIARNDAARSSFSNVWYPAFVSAWRPANRRGGSSSPADEYAFHKFADAVSPGGFRPPSA